MLEKEYTNCNLCGKDEAVLYFETEGRISQIRDKFRLAKCRDCGLAYVNPRPTKAAISRYYPEKTYYAYHPREDKERPFRELITVYAEKKDE